MAKVFRTDRGQLTRAQRLDNGFLKAPARLTRAGVFAYRTPDGQTRLELRTPEEVFRADSLASLEAAPLTDGHPPEMVTSRNVRQFSIGTVGTDVRRDADYVEGTVMVQDEDAVKAVDAGERRELSCGYHCDVDESPGVDPVHGRYDAVQKNIRYNHAALVERGRAGRDVALRLDACDAVMVDHESNPAPSPDVRHDQEPPMKLTTVRIDGVDYEMPEQAAQAHQRELARRDERVAELEKDLEKKGEEVSTVQAKLDAKEEELEKAKEATQPEAIREAVEARLDLERTAVSVLGEQKATELKLDSLDDDGIRKAVIKAVSPKADLDDKDAAYVAARYDQAVEQAKDAPAGNPGLAAVRQRADSAAGQGGKTANQARAEMIERNRSRWKPKAEA